MHMGREQLEKRRAEYMAAADQYAQLAMANKGAAEAIALLIKDLVEEPKAVLNGHKREVDAAVQAATNGARPSEVRSRLG